MQSFFGGWGVYISWFSLESILILILVLNKIALQIKHLLGDYDAIHVRRGDILKTRKDRFGIERSLHPHLDRDTRPEFIQQRIVKWIPPGRTLFIASNERSPGFFSPLSSRYACNVGLFWGIYTLLDTCAKN